MAADVTPLDPDPRYVDDDEPWPLYPPERRYTGTVVALVVVVGVLVVVWRWVR